MRTWAILLVLFLAGFGNSFAQLPDRWPEPPRQHAPWRAVESVPTNLLSAVETLYDQGFPDPRGCEYREIEVEVIGVWGGKPSTAKTCGWVLPGNPQSKTRHAICWNGLIYPLKSVGPAADLHADIATLVLPGSRRFDSAIGENRSVFSTNSPSSRVLLLLRLGEVAAAVKNWKPNEQAMAQFHAARNSRGSAEAMGVDYDPYLELAGDWAWGLFDQTLSAHMRGDETPALASARKLSDVQPGIEAEAARRRFPQPGNFDSTRQSKKQSYLSFLDQLPEILSDLERRSREGQRVSVIESGLEKITKQSERIKALIRDLDLVEARQWSQPGGVELTMDPIVAALIQEGDAAVEPLLTCLETDKRLTRSVSFHRDFFRRRNVLSVSSAARSALQAILQAGFNGGAPEIRAYWNRFKNFKLEDRWHEMLRDDSSGMGRWAEAAANITRPENVNAFPGGFTQTKPVSSNAFVRLRGEALRAKSNPTVSELMARRATQVPEANPDAYELSTACEIALHLAEWDSKAAVPVAKTLVERCRTVMEYSDKQNSWPIQRLGTFIARLTAVRVQGGETQGFDDYANWLKATTPDQLDSYLFDSLEPLRKFPTNAVLQGAAEALFSNTNSPWSRLPWKGPGFHDPVESELVQLPAFRQLVSRELDRDFVCGSAEWHGSQMVSFQITNSMNMSGSRQLTLPENELPANGAKAELRWCDWIAWSLANAKQIPPFNVFAPVAQRDRVITDAKAKLAGQSH